MSELASESSAQRARPQDRTWCFRTRTDTAPGARAVPILLRNGGVPPDLVRISVGLEDVDNIVWDLDQALGEASKEAP